MALATRPSRILPAVVWALAALLLFLRCRDAPQFDFIPVYVAAQLTSRGQHPVMYEQDPVHANRAGPNFQKAAHELGIQQISTPYLYPPFYAFLMQPATWLDFSQAKALMLFAGLVCLLAAMLLLTHNAFSRPPSLVYRLTAPAVAAAATPVYHSLWLGQNSLLLLLVLVLSLHLLNRRQDVLCGMGLGFCTAVKITPVMFLLVMALSAHWRVLLAGTATVAVLHLVALPWTGIRALVEYLRVLFRLGPQTGLAAANNQSFQAWLLRLGAPVEDLLRWRRLPVPPWSQLMSGPWIVGLGAAVWYGLLRRRPRSGHRQENLVLFSAAALLCSLAPHLVWDHHLVLLAFPLLLTLGPGSRRRLWWILALALLAANTWGIPLLLFSPGELQQSAGLRGLVVSANLYGGIVLLVLSCSFLSGTKPSVGGEVPGQQDLGQPDKEERRPAG